jgi:hypothetical protein
LAWGLIWDGDWDAGTIASVYDIDLASASEVPAPIPEPSTIFLLGTGLAGLLGYSKRKFLIKQKEK